MITKFWVSSLGIILDSLIISHTCVDALSPKRLSWPTPIFMLLLWSQQPMYHMLLFYQLCLMPLLMITKFWVSSLGIILDSLIISHTCANVLSPKRLSWPIPIFMLLLWSQQPMYRMLLFYQPCLMPLPMITKFWVSQCDPFYSYLLSFRIP
jgi:hypothetical protein